MLGTQVLKSHCSYLTGIRHFTVSSTPLLGLVVTENLTESTQGAKIGPWFLSIMVAQLT